MAIANQRPAKLPAQNCPSCGTVLDAATCITADECPGPGDITVCIKCGHVMAFADDLSFRELNDREMEAIAGDKLLLALQRARALFK